MDDKLKDRKFENDGKGASKMEKIPEVRHKHEDGDKPVEPRDVNDPITAPEHPHLT